MDRLMDRESQTYHAPLKVASPCNATPAPRPSPTTSIDREAVEQPLPAGAHQGLLAAAAGRVGRVPRGVAAAGAVGMADLGGAGAAAGPVVARVVGAVRIGAAVGLRAGQHVVPVGGVAGAVDHRALLVERR